MNRIPCPPEIADRTQAIQKQIGPLTFGAALGTCVGLAISLFGFFAISEGSTQRSYESLLAMALAGTAFGCLLGVFAESLVRHPLFATNTWIKYIIRPIAFCTLPFLFVALSLQYFGYDKLMHGFGFWICIVVLPVAGISRAWRHSTTRVTSQNG